MAQSDSGQNLIAGTLGGSFLYYSSDYGHSWKSSGLVGDFYGAAMSSSGQYAVTVPYDDTISILAVILAFPGRQQPTLVKFMREKPP